MAQNDKKHDHHRMRIFVSMLVILTPFFGMVLIELFAPQGWFWRSTSFHAFMETIGGMMAMIVALLLNNDAQRKKDVYHKIFATALMSMGILDLFHAMTHVGDTFVVLRSFSLLLGGIIFSFVILPEKVRRVLVSRARYGAPTFAVTTALVLLILHAFLPAVALHEQIMTIVTISNMVAGSLFVVASIWFFVQFQRDMRNEQIFLATFVAFFAIQSIVFNYATMWGAQWWWIHGVRFVSYGLAFYYIFLLYRDIYKKLRLSQRQLGKALAIAKKRSVQANQHKKILAQKVKDLEALDQATLNILEDVEGEKQRAQRLAQELGKFRLAVDNATDQIVITDTEGIVLYVNAAATKITGFAWRDIIGKKAGSKELWGGLMSQPFYAALWRTIKEEKKAFTGTYQNKRKNGERYYATGSITPILDKKGDVTFFVAIERDTTKEREVDVAKTEFVSLASHQLRTPLSAINWYAEMLLAGDAGALNEEQREYVQEMYTGNQRMVTLVNGLLNISRLELGTFTVEPEEVDVETLAKSVLQELDPLVKEKKITLVETQGDPIPVMQADPKLLRMILQNILSNAIKYTPEKGRVTLNMRFVPTGKKVHEQRVHEDYFMITVADTGYGIPESQQDKIFTKLFRADNVRALDTEGTGLGLYVVKAIVDNAGGAVWFDSVEQEGTTFYIALPMRGMQKKEGTRTLHA